MEKKPNQEERHGKHGFKNHKEEERHGKHGFKNHKEGWKSHHERRPYEGTQAPKMEKPILPDESGWYIPSTDKPSHHGSRHMMASGTGAVLTSAAVGIFLLAVVLILLAAILYRKRKLAARRQRSVSAAQRNLYISGMGYDGSGMNNPAYVVPLNDDEKKAPLPDSFFVIPREYPALLDDIAQPPSYQEALTTEPRDLQPPSYSLEADDNNVEVPVLRRLSITLPDEENELNKVSI